MLSSHIQPNSITDSHLSSTNNFECEKGHDFVVWYRARLRTPSNLRFMTLIPAISRERKIKGSIPGCGRPKTLKLVVAAFSVGAQDYGNSTRTGPPVSG